MRDWLWFVSVALEFAVLMMPAVRRELPMFSLWLLFSVVTDAINIWAHVYYPTGGLYRIPWEMEQPGVVATALLAGRECWNNLGGPMLTKTSIFLSFLIYETVSHGWPHSILAVEFGTVAITSSTIGMITIASIIKALENDLFPPSYLGHGFIMAGYFLLIAMIYYIVPVERDLSGLMTGIVAVLGYGSWVFYFAPRYHRNTPHELAIRH